MIVPILTAAPAGTEAEHPAADPAVDPAFQAVLEGVLGAPGPAREEQPSGGDPDSGEPAVGETGRKPAAGDEAAVVLEGFPASPAQPPAVEGTGAPVPDDPQPHLRRAGVVMGQDLAPSPEPQAPAGEEIPDAPFPPLRDLSAHDEEPAPVAGAFPEGERARSAARASGPAAEGVKDLEAPWPGRPLPGPPGTRAGGPEPSRPATPQDRPGNGRPPRGAQRPVPPPAGSPAEPADGPFPAGKAEKPGPARRGEEARPVRSLAPQEMDRTAKAGRPREGPGTAPAPGPAPRTAGSGGEGGRPGEGPEPRAVLVWEGRRERAPEARVPLSRPGSAPRGGAEAPPVSVPAAPEEGEARRVPLPEAPVRPVSARSGAGGVGQPGRPPPGAGPAGAGRTGDATPLAGTASEPQGPGSSAGDEGVEAGAGPAPPARAPSVHGPREAPLTGTARAHPAVLHTLERVRWAWSRGMDRVTVRLFPPSLGRVEVTLQRRRGGLAARLRVETPEALRVLGDGMAALRQGLEARGVEVLHVVVDLGDPGQEGRRHHAGRRDLPVRARPERLADEAGMGLAAASPPPSADRAQTLDVVI